MKKNITYPLHIGPIHPAFKEPIRFIFEIEGEKIHKSDIDFGHTHRAIEYCISERNFIQTIYLVERVCGICSVSHPMAYCISVENAADIEVPPRAQYVRTIIGELERLHSHLLWSGVAAHEIGFETLFMYTWNIREKVLDCLEQLTGNRINYGMITIGGVRRDITEEQFPLLDEIIEHYYHLYTRIGDMMLDDESVRMRCQGVGVLLKEDALALCAVGPTARASGVNRDVRTDYPVNAYPDIPWLAPLSPEKAGRKPDGDVYSRMLVRVMEMKQSLNIIGFCMENMPQGPVTLQKNAVLTINKLKKLEGTGIGRYEAPRGEVTHLNILNKKEGPASLKIKAPTYSNAAAWTTMLNGAEIADIPIIVSSIDPCVACMERLCAVNNKGTISALSYKELHKKGIEKMKEIKSECGK